MKDGRQTTQENPMKNEALLTAKATAVEARKQKAVKVLRILRKSNGNPNTGSRRSVLLPVLRTMLPVLGAGDKKCFQYEGGFFVLESFCRLFSTRERGPKEAVK